MASTDSDAPTQPDVEAATDSAPETKRRKRERKPKPPRKPIRISLPGWLAPVIALVITSLAGAMLARFGGKGETDWCIFGPVLPAITGIICGGVTGTIAYGIAGVIVMIPLWIVVFISQ